MELAKNQQHVVTIEGYSGEGAGVARIDGRVVFVQGALRGCGSPVESCRRQSIKQCYNRKALQKRRSENKLCIFR